MANTINYVTKYLNMLDRIYKAGSVTSILEAAANQYRLSSTDEKTIYLKTIETSGMADYHRTNGYAAGDIVVDWQPHVFTMDRGKKFVIDTMDAREAYTSIAEAGAEYQRNHVNPEIDAYRFEVLSGKAGTKVTGTLTYDDVMAAIRAAVKKLDDSEVPKENRILYVSSEVEQAMEDSGEFYKTVAVQSNNGVVNTKITKFNDMEVLPVPKARFYHNFDFGSDGFTVNVGGKEINFILLYKPAALGVVKHKTSNIINPDANTTHDGFILKHRIYHDLFVPGNAVNGIYLHRKA